jgi:hypothetical protein
MAPVHEIIPSSQCSIQVLHGVPIFFESDLGGVPVASAGWLWGAYPRRAGHAPSPERSEARRAWRTGRSADLKPATKEKGIPAETLGMPENCLCRAEAYASSGSEPSIIFTLLWAKYSLVKAWTIFGR